MMDEQPNEPHARHTGPQWVMVGIIAFFYLVITVILVISWSRHDPALQMQVAGLGMSFMYIILVWHAVLTWGRGPTIAFFVGSAVIAFASEFVGTNYGWIYGDYKYTDALGPRLGGVPLLIIVSWGVVLYSAFMLVDWLLDLRGRPRGRTLPARIAWNAVVAFSAALIVCAWDLMADPMSTSRVWVEVRGTEPWWWWSGGAYLPELQVWKGSGGIPMSNFFGWVLVPFVILLLFSTLVPHRHRIDAGPATAVPWLVYAYLYYTMLGAILEMSWIDPGLQQAALIGTFTMGPVIMLGFVRLARDHLEPRP